MVIRRMKDFNKIFPTEIVSDILTRLPAESVLECKLVCKTWKKLIQHPSFPRMHLARLSHPDSTDSGKLRYVSLDQRYDDYGHYDGHQFYNFEYSKDEDWNYVNPLHRRILFKTSGFRDFIVIGSFNGLVCVYGYDITDSGVCGPAIIFNPVTKEYICLPTCARFRGSYEDENLIGHYHLGCGFGYLAETNEYKVVRMYTHVSEPNAIEVEVYTVGSDKGWRHVGKFDVGFSTTMNCQQQHGVFLNGALHWRNTEGGMVLVFDLAEEKFRDHIPPPPSLTGTNVEEDDGGNIVLGVSGGGILYYAVGQSFQGRELNDVWLLMKKNDNLEEHHRSWGGWTKAASLDQREPFAFMKRGIVLRYDEGTVKRFVSSTSTWENLVDFTEISLQVYPHKHTIVSLKELGEKDVRNFKLAIKETDWGECSSEEDFRSSEYYW